LLKAAIAKYGVEDMNEKSETYKIASGLHHAELIDFDNNGISELLYLTARVPNADSYDAWADVSIWGYEAGELKQLYTGMYAYAMQGGRWKR
jgi:hypothetical protein